MSDTGDWEKLTPEQRLAVDAFRKRVGVHLQAEREVLEAAQPDLYLSWSFICDAHFRKDLHIEPL